MARGASRTPSRKKTAQRSTQAGPGLPGWTKGLLYVAVGFGIAYFVFGKKEISAPPTPPLTSTAQPPTPNAAASPNGNRPSAQRPAPNAQPPQNQKKSDAQRFDFYTILPSSEIIPSSIAPTPRVTQMPIATPTRPTVGTPSTTARPTESTPIAPTRPAPVASVATTTSGDRYILQSLSTSSQEGANTLAAHLRDLGVPTQVRAVQLANGKMTYRVQSGPFAEGAERDRALGLIRVQHLNPMIMLVR